MKKFWIAFMKRGMVAAWGGPAIVCIVWACIHAAGAIDTLEVDTVILGVLSSMLLAFVAAGISVVYQMEQLPRSMAVLIQMAVLYVDYLAIYLLNGWMPLKAIGFFTVVFLAIFAIVWAIIYLTTKISVHKLNERLDR